MWTVFKLAAAKLHNTAVDSANLQIGPVTKQCVIVLWGVWYIGEERHWYLLG